MSLGKNYEMAHQNLSEELINHELYRERDAALARLNQTGDYLSSVITEFNRALTAGELHHGHELWDINTDAQVANVMAMEAMIDVNQRIHEAGL